MSISLLHNSTSKAFSAIILIIRISLFDVMIYIAQYLNQSFIHRLGCRIYLQNHSALLIGLASSSLPFAILILVLAFARFVTVLWIVITVFCRIDCAGPFLQRFKTMFRVSGHKTKSFHTQLQTYFCCCCWLYCLDASHS